MAGRPPCDHDRIVELTRQGLAARLIAEIVGVTPRTVVRVRKSRGCQVYVPRPFTAEEVARAEAMFDDGCSCAEVGRTLDRNQAAIWGRWPDRGWTRKQASEFGNFMRKARKVLGDG